MVWGMDDDESGEATRMSEEMRCPDCRRTWPIQTEVYAENGVDVIAVFWCCQVCGIARSVAQEDGDANGLTRLMLRMRHGEETT
jgi:hypothetical protein